MCKYTTCREYAKASEVVGELQLPERELWSADVVEGNGPEHVVPLRACGQMLTKLIMVVQACAQAGTQPNQSELSQLPFMGCLHVLSTPYVYSISFNPHNILHWLYYSHFTGKETEAQWSEEISQRCGVGSGGTKGCLSNSLVTESQKCHRGVRRNSQGALFHTWDFHTCKHSQKMHVPRGTMQPGMAPSHSRGLLDQGLLHTSGGPSVVTKTEPGKCPGPLSALASLSSRWGSCWGYASRNMILHKACLSALWGRNNPWGISSSPEPRPTCFLKGQHIQLCFRVPHFVLGEKENHG